MVQVVTNENIGEFIANRRVPEFVAPVADAPAVTLGTPPKSADPPVTVDNGGEKEQPRDSSGKFVPKTYKPGEAVEGAKPPAAESDDDLPERVRRQIGKKHREKMEAEEFARERDADAAKERARADALERELSTLKGSKSGPTPTKSDGAPKAEDFKTVGEYAAAVAKFEVAEERRKQDEADAEKRAQADQQRRREVLTERIVATAKEIPEYAEVMESTDLVAPPHMAAFIEESELGPRIGFHLATHPDEFERLSKLTPIRAIAELGKIETKLETKAPPAEKPKVEVPPVSRAPSPITPLDGGAAVVTKDPSQMTFQELRAHRQAEARAGKR